MISFDTNVLVRYVTNDDPDQARRTADLLAADGAIYVPHTVLLEMEWLLRAAYQLERAAILTAFDRSSAYREEARASAAWQGRVF